MKFGPDHNIAKRNFSWKFHQNPTSGRYFLKICLKTRPSKYEEFSKNAFPESDFDEIFRKPFFHQYYDPVQISSWLHYSNSFWKFPLYREILNFRAISVYKKWVQTAKNGLFWKISSDSVSIHKMTPENHYPPLIWR